MLNFGIPSSLKAWIDHVVRAVKSWDSVEPYLRQILGFIGIDDVQTVRAEGMNIPPLAIHAVPNGEKAAEALVI
jgi:FMN-dependent NADH-azoreductase